MEDSNLDRDLERTFADPEVNAFADLVRHIDAEQEATQRRPSPLRIASRRVSAIASTLAVAATVALLLVAGWWLLRPASPTDAEIFAQQFEPYPMLLVQRSGGDTQLLRAQAIDLYVREEYGAAAEAFEALREQSPGDRSYIFYGAVALLADGQATESVPLFEALRQDSTLVFWEQSGEYLELVRLVE